MILIDQLISIGRVSKTHGIQGELNIALEYDLDIQQLRCLVFEIDGIYVPFFPVSVRPRGKESVLVQLEGIESDEQAASFVKHTVYALGDELPEELEMYFDECDGFDLGELVGASLHDNTSGFNGTITDYDNSTENVLLQAEDAQGNLYTFPFAGTLVQEYDSDSNTIFMNLPQGIFEM